MKLIINHQSKSSRAKLYIQSHILEGTRIYLAKPLVIIKKNAMNDSVEYDVVGVIRSKFSFKNRPEHVVSLKS